MGRPMPHSPTAQRRKVPRVRLARRLGTPSFYIEDVPQPRQPRKLWERVQEFKGHPLLMDWAARFLEQYKVPERDPAALARAVQRYAQDHIKFMREDPERFASALRTLDWGFGDCDDKSIFIATVLNSFRVPTRLVFIRYGYKRPDGTMKRVSHVFPEALIDGQWLALESVHPWPMGKSPLMEARRRGYQPKVEVIGP